MTKEELGAMYRDFLTEEGFSPFIEEDGDVTFKYEGKVHGISVDEGDEEFFRLIFAPFWDIENEEERRKVHAAACEATAKVKVAKIFPLGDDVVGSVELFLPEVDDFKPVFKRALRCLSAAVDAFVVSMRRGEKAIVVIEDGAGASVDS